MRSLQEPGRRYSKEDFVSDNELDPKNFCNGINDCSDGSDEDISICGKFLNLITQYLLKY